MKNSQSSNREEIENNSQFDNLCLFTSTFYKNDPESINRSNLALDFVRNANNLWIKVVISDGSPLAEWELMSDFEKNVREISKDNDKISIIRTQKRLEWWTKSTMADERKQALEDWLTKYPNVWHFLWIEPEKWNLITKESLTNLMKTADESNADFVIPTRKQIAETLSQEEQKSGMHTLPKFQARTETRANKALWKETWEYHDSYFGPVLLKRGTGTQEYLSSPHPTRGINVLTPIEWKKSWLSVSSTPVDYSYDPVQKTFEDGDTDAVGNEIDSKTWKQQSDTYKAKRINQYMDIVYANQKPESVFPEYYKNKIYSDDKFSKLTPEKQLTVLKNLLSQLEPLCVACISSLARKDQNDELYKAMYI